jgi:hypothetical protein
MHDVLLIGLGFLIGAVACAMSAKLLGWFNKQVASVEASLEKK